jgi:hypothetical protein
MQGCTAPPPGGKLFSRPRASPPLLLAFGLAACGRAESADEASGAIAAGAAKADRQEAARRDASSHRAAETRGEASAQLVRDRREATEEERAATN